MSGPAPGATPGASLDQSIGARVQQAREARGWSRDDLAEKLGVDSLDIASYERGEKRIGAEKLLEIADVLGIAFQRLFGISRTGRKAVDVDKRPWARIGVHLTLPDQSVRLNRAFVSIKDPDLRESIVTLVTDLARDQKTR